MGADVALVFLRGGYAVEIIEAGTERRSFLPQYFEFQIKELGYAKPDKPITVHADLKDVAWPSVDLVVECIPSALAKRISEALHIPVIGIGAGVDTDGQILVMHDLLGISSGYIPKFSKNFLQETGDIKRAISQYISDVKQGAFPGAEHSFN